MLLLEPFFKTFTKKEICNAATHVEAAFALSCGSRAEVDAMVEKALAAGGTEPSGPQDHGFMYQRGFDDLDHHHWEVLWMDPKAVQ
jgi:predicted lactoylglutathione lyase